MHAGLIRKLLVSAAALALFLPAIPARADLYSANAAYQKGDFPSAFQQFKELAELGQPLAQLHLASMYARGEGVARSNTFAHAWPHWPVRMVNHAGQKLQQLWNPS